MVGHKPLVVVPAFNEEAMVFEVVAELRNMQYEVLVIDDSSTDHTAEQAAAAGATVIQLPINLGVGGALRAGFRYAVDSGYEAIVQVDADGQHPAHQIQDLIMAATDNDAHLVIGSRYLSDDATLVPSLPRRASMWLLSKIASRIAGIRLTDTTSGFRYIRQPLLGRFANEFPNYYLGDTYEATVAAVRAGYRVVEVPAALSERKYGVSSASTSQAIFLIAKVLIVAFANLHPQLDKSREV
jgi:glycosyltransferase involved in cell wall biosynthesis